MNIGEYYQFVAFSLSLYIYIYICLPLLSFFLFSYICILCQPNIQFVKTSIRSSNTIHLVESITFYCLSMLNLTTDNSVTRMFSVNTVNVYKNVRSPAFIQIFLCFGRGTSVARRDHGGALALPESCRGYCRSRYDAEITRNRQ